MARTRTGLGHALAMPGPPGRRLGPSRAWGGRRAGVTTEPGLAGVAGHRPRGPPRPAPLPATAGYGPPPGARFRTALPRRLDEGFGGLCGAVPGCGPHPAPRWCGPTTLPTAPHSKVRCPLEPA